MQAIVIIPTYNERENLPLIVRKIFEQSLDLGILVIDDNSPDGTGQVADELASKHSQLTVYHRTKKEGLGKAYLSAFRYVLDHFSRITYIFQMDADGSHDPKDLKRMLQALETCDVVIGSRHVSGGVLHYPWYRKVLSFCANFYANLVLGLGIADSTAGYKGYRRKVVESLLTENFYSNDYGYQPETLYYAKKYGYNIKEIPVEFIDRALGKSKMSLSNMLDGMVGVLRVKFKNFRI